MKLIEWWETCIRPAGKVSSCVPLLTMLNPIIKIPAKKEGDCKICTQFIIYISYYYTVLCQLSPPHCCAGSAFPDWNSTSESKKETCLIYEISAIYQYLSIFPCACTCECITSVIILSTCMCPINLPCCRFAFREWKSKFYVRNEKLFLIYKWTDITNLWSLLLSN